MSYVPEERMRDGAIGEFTMAENLILVDYDKKPYASIGLLRFPRIKQHCTDLVKRYTVKTPTIQTPTKHLSGGNIPKSSNRPRVQL